MARSSFAKRFVAAASYRRLLGAAALAGTALMAGQTGAQQPPSPPASRIVVTGTGSVQVAPDSARIRSGVTTRAPTVKEASDANSKLMARLIMTLRDSGIAQTDIQTARFAIQPVYAPAQPGVEPKLTGYSVSNQVEVNVRQISNLGDILDRLAGAGATDVGNIAFVVSDPSKALDQAREAAIADARHKAEVFARASGATLGRVVSITEDEGFAPPTAFAPRASAAAAVPIATGEDTLQARVTVGYEIAR